MSELQALTDDVVAGNHILYHHGVVDGYGHLSFRSPSNPNRFYMAAALSPGRVTADDIIELDLDGEITSADKSRPTYSERFIHAEVYRARPEINSVLHSHSPTVIPFGVTTVPFKPVASSGSFLYPNPPIFDTSNVPEATSGVLVNKPEIGKALVGVLGQNSVVLMRGHGNTVVGRNVRETVSRGIYTELNARLLMQALALGGPITYVKESEAKAPRSTTPENERGSSHGIDRIWYMWADEVAESIERAARVRRSAAAH
jgi:ribulose-5-phosphate 4-epimerase/fuculose-1-phosphate aldolase